MPPLPLCFKNQFNQALHKYADIVLVLLLAALTWWLVQVDARVTKNSDRIQGAIVDSTGAKERGEALMKRLDGIDLKLTIIDQRIYSLFGTRGRGEPMP